MKVNVTLSVSAYERFVIAKYYAPAATSVVDKLRRRASRAQVRQFAAAAVRAQVREQVRNLRPRSRAVAHRLAAQQGRQGPPLETLPPPGEVQPELQW